MDILPLQHGHLGPDLSVRRMPKLMAKKHKAKKICMVCSQLAGKDPRQGKNWHKDRCTVCDRKIEVVNTTELGVITPEKLTEARRAAKELGLHRNQVANADDTRRLIDVVRGVLGPEYMSLQTKQIIVSIESDLEANRPIQIYDTKLLSTWYAADVQMMQETKAVKDLSVGRMSKTFARERPNSPR
jgi:hypothetical protein